MSKRWLMVDRKVVVAAAAKSLPAVAGLDLENDHVWRKSMEIDLYALEHLLKKRLDEIELIVAGTGYLPKTVIGVGTVLLDSQGEVELLTAKQQVTFERFIKPLLESSPKS